MELERILLTIAQCAPGFLLAIIIHEYSHGRVAKMFGDDTAERAGRLTFNPADHIDMMGTVIFPLIGVVAGWSVFGWAKPVPISINNFKSGQLRKAIFWVSFAGPLSNFILGTLSALALAIWFKFGPSDMKLYETIISMLKYSVFINFLLGGFNIIPFPPLDGSRMLGSFLKGEMLRKYESLAQYSFYVMMGIFALGMMGIPTIHYVIMPFIQLGNLITRVFLSII